MTYENCGGILVPRRIHIPVFTPPVFTPHPLGKTWRVVLAPLDKGKLAVRRVRKAEDLFDRGGRANRKRWRA